MRRAILLLGLALAGCNWLGDAFYAASEAEPLIAPGDYRAEPVGGAPTHSTMLRVSILPNGLSRFTLPERGNGEFQLGFAPLDPERHLHVFWVASVDGQVPPAAQTPYGIVERRADGHYFIAMPDCDRDRAEAVAAGAVPSSDQPSPDCLFPNRASLETGLGAFARHPGEGAELVPVR